MSSVPRYGFSIRTNRSYTHHKTLRLGSVCGNAIDTPTDYAAEGHMIILNKASVLSITSDPEQPTAFCANFASVIRKHTYPAGVMLMGHYFNFGVAGSLTVPGLARREDLRFVFSISRLHL